MYSVPAAAARPIDPVPSSAQAFWRRAEAAPQSSNKETLAELLASFFAHFAVAIAQWRLSNGACDVRASTWWGAWTQGSWLKSYMAGQWQLDEGLIFRLRASENIVFWLKTSQDGARANRHETSVVGIASQKPKHSFS